MATGLLPTPEQDQLRAVVRAVVADRARARREAIAAGDDPIAWKALVEQVGVAGLAIPEPLGGSGFGWGELAVVMEELAAGLVVVPVLSSVVLATGALLEAGGERAGELLRRLAGGQDRAALVVPLGLDPAAVAVTHGDGRLRASQVPTLGAAGADILLVHADTDAGIGLFEIDPGAPGIAVESAETLDLTRPMQLVSLDGVESVQLGPLDEGDAVAAVVRQGRLALAAEQVGGARACLDMAVGYARERQQFDRPIGSFQAVKHLLADLFVNVEAAVAALADAVRCVGEPRHDQAVAIAASVAGDAFVDNAEANIHVHGGIGFTWEHDAHLYYRRAITASSLFGHPRALDRELGRQLAAPR